MNNELIEELITDYLKPEFRGRLIDRGLSRSMIWENGILPKNSSDFSDELTYDLLSYGYSLLSLAIKGINNGINENLRNQAFEKAATALMTVIYNGATNNQHFGQVKNAFIRAVDASGKEMVRFNLSGIGQYDQQRSLLFAELVRENNGWKFNAVGNSSPADNFVTWLKNYV